MNLTDLMDFDLNGVMSLVLSSSNESEMKDSIFLLFLFHINIDHVAFSVLVIFLDLQFRLILRRKKQNDSYFVSFSFSSNRFKFSPCKNKIKYKQMARLLSYP